MEIYLSKRANSDYQEICAFIERRWGIPSVNKFSDKLLSFISTLEKFPLIGKIEEINNSIRGFQLTKQTKIFYKIYKNRIIILSLFDVRQSPNNKKF